MRTIFYATSVTLLIAAAACSDNKSTTDGGTPGQICPTTIVEATASSGAEGVSSKCHVDQYICVVGFQCTNNFTQQATCTCGSNGQFSCVLANGTPVQADVQQTDIAGLCAKVTNPPPTDTCPTDKTKATGTSCNNAGQQCYYSTTCTTPPRTDVCQCQPNANGDAGLSWKCDLNICP